MIEEKVFLLGEYLLDVRQRQLSRDGQIIHLSNLPFQVLVYLIEHRHRLVTRDELLERFWEGKDVYGDALRKAVGAIRKALGDKQDNSRFIETRWAEGYRYIGPLAEKPPIPLEPASSPDADTVYEKRQPANQPNALRRAFLMTTVLLAFGVGIGALYARGARPAPPRFIAVLPLKNLSGDSMQDYFSDGLTEHLLNTLARIDGLNVIARGSSFTFKEQAVNPQEAGKKLGVEAILTGSVLKQGNRLRIEVRLESTQDGRILWASDPAEHRLDDIFTLQDEIARRVVAGLRINLDSTGERQLARRYTESAAAYQAGLKGDYYRNQRTPDSLRKAIEAYQQALTLDSHYLPAYLGLAGSYYMGIWYIPLDSREAAAKAKEALAKALEIDDRSSEAHIALAGLRMLEWDWTGSLQEMTRAKELNPSFSDYGYAYHLLLYADRPDEAVRWIKRAAELDPLSPLVSANVAEILYLAHRYDEAIAQCRKALQLDPNYAMAHTHLGLASLQTGRYDEAVAAFQKAIALSDRSPDLLARLALAYAVAGRRAEARQLLTELAEISTQRHVPPYRLAEIYVALGDKDQAFAALEKAYQAHEMHLCNL
ncbi:MAG TPA: tetratricopeptide repeat protein, partial [Blastocatellia bacterium]|nr:tetratricopeptide repeat protein [Blastocatellia bacterium]